MTAVQTPCPLSACLGVRCGCRGPRAAVPCCSEWGRVGEGADWWAQLAPGLACSWTYRTARWPWRAGAGPVTGRSRCGTSWERGTGGQIWVWVRLMRSSLLLQRRTSSLSDYNLTLKLICRYQYCLMLIQLLLSTLILVLPSGCIPVNFYNTVLEAFNLIDAR